MQTDSSAVRTTVAALNSFAGTTQTQPVAVPAIDPCVAMDVNFAHAARKFCRLDETPVLGVRERKVELLVLDLDDTLAKLYAPVARLNLKYLKRLGTAQRQPLRHVAARTAALAEKNPDAVVHDPRQLVTLVFGAGVAAQPATQQLLTQWEAEKRAAFSAGLDRTLASTLAHFKKSGAKVAILSNSPQTPLRARLALLDGMLQGMGENLLSRIDVIACKPDPVGMTARPLAALSAAERAFQTTLAQSGKLMVLPAQISKDKGIGIIKAVLKRRLRLQQGIQHVVQVGDRPTDIATAHKAGAQAVWLTGNLLSGSDKIAMRMVGEAKVADHVGDMVAMMVRKPASRQAPPQRPHAIAGNIGYLQQLFRPLAPR